MISFLKKLKEVVGPVKKGKAVLFFFLIFFGAFLELFGIGVIMVFVSAFTDISTLFETKWLSPLFNFFNIKNHKDVLIYGSILLGLFFLFKNSYLIFLKYIKSSFGYNKYKEISSRLFSFYINAPYVFHLKRNSVDSIRNISIEVGNICKSVIMPILQIVSEGVVIIAISIMLFIVEPFIAFFVLSFFFLVTLFFFIVIKKKVKSYGRRSLKERKKIMQIVSEGIGGIKDILVSDRKNWFKKKFHSSIHKLSRVQTFQQTIEQSTRPIMETFAVFGMLTVSFVLLFLGRSIPSIISTLTLFAFSIYRLLPAVNNLFNDYIRIRHFSCAIDPIYNDLILEKEQRKADKKSGKEINFENEIKLSDVSYSYLEDGNNVLENVSLLIPKNKAIGIVGETGSGKTTIIDLILGLLTPQKGKVEIDKRDIRENLKSWQKKIGYVPQFIYLSDDTIYNNIAFGIEKEKIDKNKVLKATDAAFLTSFVEKLPKKLDTIVGERGIRLSGGQRQRIGIARALYHNPEVLIMDEATSSLDNITEQYVMSAIESLKKERTLIIITHRIKMIQNCDIIYFLKEGKLVASGNYEELLEKNKEFNLMANS